MVAPLGGVPNPGLYSQTRSQLDYETVGGKGHRQRSCSPAAQWIRAARTAGCLRGAESEGKVPSPLGSTAAPYMEMEKKGPAVECALVHEEELIFPSLTLGVQIWLDNGGGGRGLHGRMTLNEKVGSHYRTFVPLVSLGPVCVYR